MFGAITGVWWLFLITGIAWLIIALIVLRFDTASIATVGSLLGIVFLIAGLNEGMIAVVSPSSTSTSGRASVGIEVPNPGGGEIIALRDVVESEKFQSSPSLLTLALGKDIHGEPVVDDLRRMPTS